MLLKKLKRNEHRIIYSRGKHRIITKTKKKWKEYLKNTGRFYDKKARGWIIEAWEVVFYGMLLDKKDKSNYAFFDNIDKDYIYINKSLGSEQDVIQKIHQYIQQKYNFFKADNENRIDISHLAIGTQDKTPTKEKIYKKWPEIYKQIDDFIKLLDWKTYNPENSNKPKRNYIEHNAYKKMWLDDNE